MKKILSFIGVLIAVCVFEISIGAPVPQLKYIEENLVADDLESFEEIVLGQTEDNKNQITALYEPAKEDSALFEIAQDLFFVCTSDKFSFTTPTILANNFTIYHTVFYKDYLHTITPPPPQV